MRLSRRLAIAVALATFTLGSVLILYRFGRSLWHPVLVRVTGGATVAQRLREIESRHPDLPRLTVGSVRLIGFKDPGRLDVLIDGRPWRSFAWTARSGGPGPKLRAGDGQIPEGLYRINGVNPNSSYHLSLRISYPNEEDLIRSRKAGISDPGGDIYIHGKASSIGCIAIGDQGIEQVFQVVNRVEPDSVEVLILPCDLRQGPPPPGNEELYGRLRAILAAWLP